MQGFFKDRFREFKSKANDAVIKEYQNQAKVYKNQMTSFNRNAFKVQNFNTTRLPNSELYQVQNLPEKLEDPRKFLIPCALQELDRTSALANSGASINLLPHSIYKQLGLGALTPTRMTLELANRSITHPMGIAEDVVVRVDGFTFLADFVGLNLEPDPELPIIFRRPFRSQPAKALIDLYAGKITLRQYHKSNQYSSSVVLSPVKTSDNLEEFADELTLLKKVIHEENFQVYSNPLFEFEDNFTSSNVNPLFNEMDEDAINENSNVSDSDEPVLLNTPLSDKVECFAPEDDIDEIDAFLAMEVSSNFEEGYFNSEGDVTFLDNILSDDTTHNLAYEVISDHEPEQNESSITFCPRSDPLHHEFENVHANPSSIIASPILVEDSDPVQEEIDIFLVPDDLIPPGVENDDSEDEDNELPNLDHQDNPSSPRPPLEPPDFCLDFKPNTAMKNDEDFNQGEIVLSLNVEDVNSFTFVIWTFLPFFTYPEDSPVILSLRNEDTIFDPGIITFPFSYLEQVAFSMEVSCSKCFSP
ncbi:reverse transcriptase domain-containing protein [Tanacetum coccineum]